VRIVESEPEGEPAPILKSRAIGAKSQMRGGTIVAGLLNGLNDGAVVSSCNRVCAVLGRRATLRRVSLLVTQPPGPPR
jgi:hypothetical protein